MILRVGGGNFGQGSRDKAVAGSNDDGVSTQSGHETEKLPRKFVAVNAGTLAYVRPTAGASAHGGSGDLAMAPNENMNRLLQVMGREDSHGRKLVAGWVLSSTCLPKPDIRRALVDFENVGYKCQESHGVQGERRREIAGVIICAAPEQFRFLKVGKLFKHKKVIRRGRILQV